MTDLDEREVIAGGLHRPPRWKHLLPVARFLVEQRGHLPLHEPERWGLTSGQDGDVFRFSRRITEADWEAINRRFVLPSNIGFHRMGLIRDNENGVDFTGAEEILTLDGLVSAEAWEERERALDRTYGRPDLGEGKAGPVPSS